MAWAPSLAACSDPIGSSRACDPSAAWYPYLKLRKKSYQCGASDEGSAVRSQVALERDVTPIDQKIARGDEGCVVGCKIDRSSRDLLRLARAVEDMARTVAGAGLLLAAGSCAGAFP